MIFKIINLVVRQLAYFFCSLFVTFTCFAIGLKLPEPVSNNAVTVAKVKGVPYIFSFNGLSAGKTYQDIHAHGFSVNLKTGNTRVLASLPDGLGRLASTAVTVKNKIYVIGGYTVAADHSEISTPQIYQYSPIKNIYRHVTNMPTPVDDTVALVYQNRYIYLISGWFNTGNVNLVQVFDTVENRWFNATPFPGAAVFGHAGGIAGRQLLIADGVKVVSVVDGKNQYGASDENWIGEIKYQNPAIIIWTKIKKHPFKPLYRMAGIGLENSGQIVFAGGSDNPYNYNGIGYNKQPSEASSRIFSYNLRQNKWLEHNQLSYPSMDHRGLLAFNEHLYIAGGMGDNQKVLATIQKISISSLSFDKESK